MTRLELLAAELLARGHPALPPQLGVGEGVEEVAVGAHGQVGVEGVVLAVLEGLEAVEDEGLAGPSPRLVLREEEQAWRPRRLEWRWTVEGERPSERAICRKPAQATRPS